MDDTLARDIEDAHRLYEECERVLSHCYYGDFLDQARSEREERFWVHVADFFLDERQRELVSQGAF